MKSVMVISADDALIVTISIYDNQPTTYVVSVNYVGVECPPFPITKAMLKVLESLPNGNEEK